MIKEQDKLYKDLEAIRQIPIVPTMLEVVCHITGMGFAAVARVSEDRWLACSVRDEVNFGLAEGGELPIETTLCNEIRDHRQVIVIDNVAEDPRYAHHHTPRIYGLQSYISYPIILKDGTFFGTLCAISAETANVNNSKVIGTFKMFTDLLSFHLHSIQELERSYAANLELKSRNQVLVNMNFDLDNFVYTASHDLKSPVANIEGLIQVLSTAVERQTLNRDEIREIIQLLKYSLKRFSTTIKDLTTIVEVDKPDDCKEPEPLNFNEVLEDVKQELGKLILETGAQIEVAAGREELTGFSRKNLKSILSNLISNAMKYRSPDRQPHVLVKLEEVEDKMHLSVQDNGLGIPTEKQDSVFTMFKRLHDHVEGSGIGLYIVKRMVDNVKGQIKVKSIPNEGTTFTIIF